MTAEQWLNDLEAKAAEVKQQYGELRTIAYSEALEAYITASNPSAVLRLVAMVRTISERAGKCTNTCPFDTPMTTRPAGWRCPEPGHKCANAHLCEIEAAYQRIYTAHVKPLEDELAKSKDWMTIAAKCEADKAALVEALEDASSALMRCESTFSFIYHRGNSSVAESGLKAAINAQEGIAVALARVKGEV